MAVCVCVSPSVNQPCVHRLQVFEELEKKGAALLGRLIAAVHAEQPVLRWDTYDFWEAVHSACLSTGMH